jgi:hypothetical protein
MVHRMRAEAHVGGDKQAHEIPSVEQST